MSIIARTYNAAGRDLSEVEVSVRVIRGRGHLTIEWPTGRVVRILLDPAELLRETEGDDPSPSIAARSLVAVALCALAAVALRLAGYPS